MEFFKVLFLIFIVSSETLALPDEPACSKFDYEIKTLEVMLRTEQKVEKMVEDMKAIRETVLKELKELDEFKSNLLEDFKRFKDETEDQTRLDQESREEIQVLSNTLDGKLELVSDVLEKMNSKKQDNFVAFSVTHPTKKFVKGVPIFSKMITNIGGGYNMDTGVFTSPFDGLYLFIFTVASNGQNDVYCYIYRNDTIVAFGRSYNDNSYTTAAAAVYLALSKGDKVKLGGCGGWNNVYCGNEETIFSGALIIQSLDEN